MIDIQKTKTFKPPIDWEPVFAAAQGKSVFGSEPSALARSALRYLRDFGSDPADCRALDLGSGDGRDTLFFASVGMHVVSADLAPSGIRKTTEALASAGIPAERVDAAVVDARAYDYPENTFDLAMAANVLQFLPPDDARECITKLQRTAKPGGIVAVGVFSPAMAAWGTDLSPFFTATADELMAFFPASEGWLLCDRTEYWTYRVDNDTMGSFAFVVARKLA